MTTRQPVKPGLSAPIVTSIPTQWSASWFRSFITNYLQGGDVRNITAGDGIAVSTSNPPSIGLAPMPPDTVLGNATGETLPPTNLTEAQLTALVKVFSRTTSGAVPAPGTQLGFFLRDDGTWAAIVIPPSSGAPGPVGPPGLDGEPGEEGMPIPGNAGAPGAAGTTGAPGPPGPAVFLEADGADGDWGPPGPAGPVGPAGTGGSTLFNVTADSHTSTPGNVANDEFESGTSLDTTGARFAGATAWTLKGNTTGYTSVVASGSIMFGGVLAGVNSASVASQPIASSTGAWDIRCKVNSITGVTTIGGGNATFSGLFAGLGATGKGYYFGRFTGSGSSNKLLLNSNTIYAGGTVTGVFSVADLFYTQTGTAPNSFSTLPTYLRITYDGTSTLTFFGAYDGITWLQCGTVSTATLLGGPADTIGLFIGSTAANAQQMCVDWFRRIL